MAVKQVSLKAVVELMKAGYVRYKSEDKGDGLGSVEEELDLSTAVVKDIMKHPKLKGMRVKVPTHILVDDYEETEEDIADRTELIDDTAEQPVVAVIETPVAVIAPVATVAVNTTEAELEAILTAGEDTEAAIFA